MESEKKQELIKENTTTEQEKEHANVIKHDSEEMIRRKIELVMRAKAREAAAEKYKAEQEAEKKRQMQEAAAAYAKYLKDRGIVPGEATFVEPEELGVKLHDVPDEPVHIDEADVQEAVAKAEMRTRESVNVPAPELVGKPVTAEKKEDRKTDKKNEEKHGFAEGVRTVFAAPIFLHDKIQDAIDNAFIGAGRGLATEAHKWTVSYRNSRKAIGFSLLTVFLMCALVLVIFDRFTVYEYAYNGKVLGYVDTQEDVTNVLNIAGEELNSVSEGEEDTISFSAGDNISFKKVESSGKDIDDADATVNKLAYMTDIEVEAYGIYDGNNLITIVESQRTAENLLTVVKEIFGAPDEGMEVVSVEFKNPLEIKPVKVLLTSVQSSGTAQQQMTKGGKANFYHIVEEKETLGSIAKTFGVKRDAIYDADNENAVEAVEQGDKICIHKTVEPVSVELVETGRMREVIPYETIREDSEDYYIGDEVVGVEGVDGVQIFAGTLTKVAGTVTARDTESIEVITEKVDEVILVGITERPKTAPTGVFKNPMLPGTYVVTSRPGYRWGRTHEGVDMGASTGTNVFASDGGTVVRASYYGGYGNCIDIEHADGWITRYGHLSYIGVSVGEKVYQGQYIGNVGSTGRSTGPHLHFETRHNGSFVNPDEMVEGGL